ncbi:MAG: hypothetical protein ACYC5K_11415 [Saccharofermentanales bacterium]
MKTATLPGPIDIHQKRGAISLEITMVIPAVMVLLFAFIWQISTIRNEMIYKSIVMKESEKIALTGAAFEVLERNDKVQELTAEHGEIADIVAEETYRIILEYNCLNHYRQFLVNKKRFTRVLIPEYSFTERELADGVIYFTSVYSLHTPFGRRSKSFTIPLRTWHRGDSSGKIGTGKTENVWQMENFERGRLIRARFGGNLPMGYPVLSGYSSGNALVIKSMDLTKASWSDPLEVLLQLRSEMTDLILFEGTELPWGKDGIRIFSGDIRSRFFKLIIPENTEQSRYLLVFNELNGYCRANDVEFEISCYQKSEDAG